MKALFIILSLAAGATLAAATLPASACCIRFEVPAAIDPGDKCLPRAVPGDCAPVN